MGWGLMVRLVPQPSQSPDLNMTDLSFFTYLTSRSWGRDASSVDDSVETISEQFIYGEYDGNTL